MITQLTMPRVSVCVPTYNGAMYLEECLDSVLNQTYKDIEILVVDDGSTDATFEILERYAASDERIRLVRNENNLGLVGNWNHCIELAKGEWIKFVFQDDWIEPECLEAMLDAGTLNCSIVACQRNFAFEEGVSKSTQQDFLNIPTLSSLFPGTAVISAETYSEATVDHFTVNFVGEPTAVMLHRSVFEKFGLFNPRLIQLCDFEFWTRIAVHTGIAFVPRTLATFRLHGDSTTAKNAKHGYGIELDVLSMVHDFVFLPVYAPLRFIAMNRNPPFDLTQELGKMTRGTRWLAIDAANRLGDPSLLHEWATFLQSYPALLPFVDKQPCEQPSYFKKIRRILGEHFLWRVK
ncbi:MAG: glycosyltransferase family 2 protein [Candidatus Nitrotoga sp.]|nr:glycosyltransferase family 2 protein [Candidatus Nitrotoga sp.]MDO9446839.1 glycosyltransferase family 2 protein [Candidatus Nitrotoga sp.]